MRPLARLLTPLLAGALTAVLLIAPPQPANAFKPTSHMLISELALNSLVERDGRYFVTILGKEIPVDREIGQALTLYPDLYLAGAIGPDAYPDPLFGQSVIHPAGSDTWLRRVWSEARRYGKAGSDARLKAVAFAQGFLSHGAADFWGHAFVNHHAGGVFPELSDVGKIDIAVKHVILETYMDSLRPTGPRLRDAVNRGLNLDSASDLDSDNRSSASTPPYGFIKQALMQSPEAEAYLKTTPLFKMLDRWRCGGDDCDEYFPSSDDLEDRYRREFDRKSFWEKAAMFSVRIITLGQWDWVDVYKRFNPEWLSAPTEGQQRDARDRLLRRYSQYFGSLFIDKFVFAKAPEASAAAQQRSHEAWTDLMINGFCPVALDRRVCSGVDNLRELARKVAEITKQSFPHVHRMLQRLQDQIDRMIESAIDHVLGELQAMLERSDVPQGKREWVMRVLDVDKDGQITYRDLQNVDFAHVAKLVVNGDIDCPDGRDCFDGEAVNRGLGISNPLTTRDQVIDPQRFAAAADAVSTIKLNFLDSKGRRELVSSFAPGGPATFEPIWTWLTTMDGHGHGLDRHRFNETNKMGATQWDMFRNDTLRRNLFNRLFTEPVPGFFDRPGEEHSGEGTIPRRTMGSFVSGVADTLCMDAAGASDANGTKLQLWGCNDTPAQQASLLGNTLKLNGKCVDVNGAETANGTRIQLWDCNGTAAQRFSYRDGQLRILGKCVDASRRAVGADIHLWDCHSDSNQKWHWRADRTGGALRNDLGTCLGWNDWDNNYLYLADCSEQHVADRRNWQFFERTQTQLRKPVWSDKIGQLRSRMGGGARCLDVEGGATNTKNGARIHLWDCHEGSSQRITKASPFLRLNGKCVDAQGGQRRNGTPLVLWDCNGSDAQKFTFKDDGTIRALDRCVDVEGGHNGNGSVIHLWDCHGGENQKWDWRGQGGSMCVKADGTGDGSAVRLTECSDTSLSRIQFWQEGIDGGFQIRIDGKCLDAQGGDRLGRVLLWSCHNSTNQRWSWWPQHLGSGFESDTACDAEVDAAGVVSAQVTPAAVARGKKKAERPCLQKVRVAVTGRQATIRWKDWSGWTFRTKFSRPGGTTWPKRWSAETRRAKVTREIRMGTTYKVRVQGVHRTDEPGHRTHRSEPTTVTFSTR